MSKFQSKRISRRGAFAGAIASLGLLVTHSGAAQQSERPATIDLDHGLEVRDYRLFPTDDVMRFIVELHNTTDRSLDAPNLGVEIPELESDGNFGWANPIGGIIYPNSSQMLLGKAPMHLHDDASWGTPKWIICDEIQTTMSESADQWNIEYSHRFEVVENDHLRIWFTITNHGHKSARSAFVHGIVRDNDNRICGAMLPVTAQSIPPGETGERSTSIRPRVNYAANPFTLIDSIDDFDVSFSMQHRLPAVNSGCSVLFPEFSASFE